jgi:hypothetical protein
MRLKLTIAFLFLLNSLFAQSQSSLFGAYERKWSAHSILTLLPDSTFSEEYVSFSCGFYASVFEDKVFKGRWKVNKNILELSFNPTKHNSSWNVSNYFIDTVYGQLIQVNIKEANYLDYVKTKSYDKTGIEIWELNPKELINHFDSLLLDKDKYKRDKIISLLNFWLKDQEIESSVVDIWKIVFYDILYSKPHNTFEQVYFIGRLKYGLNNPEDKTSHNFVRAGLKEIATVYKTKFREKYRSKSLDALVVEEEKDDFESFITKRLK